MKVYVPSLPTRFDKATGEQVPSLDLNPATAHGELTVITRGPQATGAELDDAIQVVAEAAEDYNPLAGDSVLMVGDPILNVTFIAAYARTFTDPVRVLRWDRSTHSYSVVSIDL